MLLRAQKFTLMSSAECNNVLKYIAFFSNVHFSVCRTSALVLLLIWVMHYTFLTVFSVLQFS